MKLLALFLVTIFLSLPVIGKDIKYIEIRNSDFKVIYKINGLDRLNKFDVLFKNRVKLESPPKIEWPYKIDVVPGSRWLYNPEGYVRMLNVIKKPTYRVSEFEELNLLINIHNKRL